MESKAIRKVYIVTGATRGLGRALAEAWTASDTLLVLVGRKGLPEVVNAIKAEGGFATGINYDLTKPDGLEELMNNIFKLLSWEQLAAVALVNNAGVVEPVGFIGTLPDQEAIDHFHVNAMAPIILSNAFIKGSKNFKGRRVIVNISSGAGKRPIEGWGLYCASKAAVEMFTQCVLKEQSTEGGVDIFAIDPGVLDTKMQSEIRKKSKSDFPGVERFIDLYKNGMLKEPKIVAAEIVQYIGEKLGS